MSQRFANSPSWPLTNCGYWLVVAVNIYCVCCILPSHLSPEAQCDLCVTSMQHCVNKYNICVLCLIFQYAYIPPPSSPLCKASLLASTSCCRIALLSCLCLSTSFSFIQHCIPLCTGYNCTTTATVCCRSSFRVCVWKLEFRLHNFLRVTTPTVCLHP